jgi:hypothetical protein
LAPHGVTVTAVAKSGHVFTQKDRHVFLHAQTQSCRTGLPASVRLGSPLTRVPLQGHTADKARAPLPDALHPQGRKQQQVREEGGLARSAQATQAAHELRAHEAPDGALD